MSNRAHNFNPGPAVLPLSVLEETREAVVNFANLGMSIMEMSHRSKEFEAIAQDAEKDALAIMGLSAQDYAVCFLGGGASLQFAMVPMNFLQTKADYLVTGEWATKAAKEAKMFGAVIEAASSKDKNFNYLPKSYRFSPDADYVHITTNNTIYGTEWKVVPDVGNVPLISDMSSDVFGVKREWSRYSLMYAGAQKNLGPAGVTMVVIKRSYLEAKAKEQVSSMLKYKTHVDGKSLYNTPPVFAIYVLGRTLKWIQKEGGLGAIEARNQKKAKLIYDVIDARPAFYKGTVTDKADRSIMNLTWNLPTPELEETFVAEAKKKGMVGLKGHRSVGGIRSSQYNACPVESVETLAKFMEEFYAANK
jgi:phosphoserine aminotransferase